MISELGDIEVDILSREVDDFYGPCTEVGFRYFGNNVSCFVPDAILAEGYILNTFLPVFEVVH